MALQFRRYARSQIFAFDFGSSIRAAALAMSGDWHDLGGSLAEDASEPVALQPLAGIDAEEERAWAAAWVAAILPRATVYIPPDVTHHVRSSLDNLASPPHSPPTHTVSP